MDLERQLSEQLNIQPEYVTATVKLLDKDNTVPFIARYRKESTGGLDEEQIRNLKSLLESKRNVEKRRQTIVKSIADQGKLTQAIQGKLISAASLTELEDIYQQFKPKRQTRASIAKEKGYQPLADLIITQPLDKVQLHGLAIKFERDRVGSAAEVLAGARDIVAETISDHRLVRQRTRDSGLRWATLSCSRIEANEDARGNFKLYYDYKRRVDRLLPHQILAINRGEAEKILRVKIEIPEHNWRQAIATVFRPDRRSQLASQLVLASEDAAKRLLLPAIERDIRRILTENAENHAISLFAINLKNLLLQPPLSGNTILGLDPGYRTGCKIAVIDPNGTVLATATIYPHAPKKKWQPALDKLELLIRKYQIDLIAIGNGTASRESERLVADYNRTTKSKTIQYLIVNEAGASVYSASPLARQELPDLDVTLRGAVSIARRAQDPLAELVKIDPRSIGVGLYQHDIDQALLRKTLDDVVESVVNQVGVDVNTASPALLTHVSGIGPKLAENIVSYRDENGAFANREALRNVRGLGLKSFEQGAGFLRIRNGDNMLDASAIHPESYSIAKAVLARAGLRGDEPPEIRKKAISRWQDPKKLAGLASDIGTGIPTLQDIMDQLVNPGRDPREELPPPILRDDVISMEDLQPGMQLMGTVRNVVDFGSFIDIGVKQDGLLHRNQLPPGLTLSVGDIVKVKIINVESERSRISLGWSD